MLIDFHLPFSGSKFSLNTSSKNLELQLNWQYPLPAKKSGQKRFILIWVFQFFTRSHLEMFRTLRKNKRKTPFMEFIFILTKKLMVGVCNSTTIRLDHKFFLRRFEKTSN